MASAAQSYVHLTRLLRVAPGAVANVEPAADTGPGELDWQQILQLADKEHMTGTLAAVLQGRNMLEMVPKQFRAALERRHLMSRELNKRIRRQAEETVRILNDLGCTPMMLKGGLHLFEASPEMLGARFLRDLDILVPESSIDSCIQGLREAGYVPEGEDEDWTYHYRPMRHPKHMLAIELHIRPGEQRSFLTPEEAWSQAVQVGSPDLKVLALGPAHRIAHNVFHSEVQDYGYLLGSICLRQLYDLANICARYESGIDWQDIAGRMERHGMSRMFRARMYMACELLGAPRPPISVEGPRSRFHLARCLAQLRWPQLRKRAQRFVGTAGRVFKRHHIDLLYGCGPSGIRLQWCRARHLWNLIKRHRSTLRVRLNMYGQRFE